MAKFWIVMGDGSFYGDRHETEQSARDEAARLCKEKGGTFYVLEVVATCERDVVVWTEQEREKEIVTVPTIQPFPGTISPQWPIVTYGGGGHFQ